MGSKKPRLITVIILIVVAILAVLLSIRPTQRTIEGKTTPLFSDTPENRENGLFGQPVPKE